MSVRAHRILKVEHADYTSFNLWHDKDLVEYLDREHGIFDQMNSGGGGVICVPVEVLEQALAELDLEEDVVEALKRDIEACKEDDCVAYDCF